MLFSFYPFTERFSNKIHITNYYTIITTDTIYNIFTNLPNYLQTLSYKKIFPKQTNKQHGLLQTSSERPPNVFWFQAPRICITQFTCPYTVATTRHRRLHFLSIQQILVQESVFKSLRIPCAFYV